jgi:16S rRNA (guanine1207-N2)-methyltransferase
MSLSAPSQLLLRNSELFDGRVMLINPPADELAYQLLNNDRIEQLTLFSQFYADHLAHINLQHERLETGFGFEPEDGDSFDHVLLFCPREKARTRMLLHLAATQANSQGKLWLVGENRAGIKSSGRLLTDFAEPLIKQDAARHCVLFSAKRHAELRPFERAEYRQVSLVDAPGGALELVSYPGVFSHGELDAGTRLLLQQLQPRSPLLDFACGCGVIAAWAARCCPDAEITAADTDALALAATGETLAKLSVSASILPCDGWRGIEGRFKQVVSNPPFHRGVRTNYSTSEGFIQQLPKHLVAGGQLILVANTFLDYPNRIRDSLGQCHVLAEDRRFRVYSARMA